ncbi:tRNA (adenosine(37)-N6)-threonylcarbamoyltransferase complex dimerization subunit type 1 TsaB [Ligilactobacillus agilis]|uniref:tRNA (adenosine(37)-N6)-threonylcarbamoyltransferase complex dimerization subunit type 1 TsaB n=1 Tax=Ligilactobacillus agilis TaxID=1601 RepID=UPI002549F25E|nr:tRNA (adenosine(37)-N6)-threonylcarbamoyltransferase complex dimerization subunit type 1 TsaB [Ligilactobacillus agilis]MDK6809848.1 tRNA (adenosine(37)-N6)-threonylcarbamoyltransferase complex dimerization subunit type 1 TsaB [Ligilactobacillus agilis]
MKILAIDTSNKPLSVAVLEDQELLAEITTNAQRNHSITLMPLIKEVLQRANVKVADLDRIAVAQGPGSYTGLRIGVTTAKTLAFTLNKELVGVSSLKTLAVAYPNTEALLVPVFDARRENVFAAAYQWQAGHLVEVIAEGHYAFANLCQRLADFNQKVIFIGRDSQNFASNLKASDLDYQLASPNFAYPRAMEVALLGQVATPVAIQTFVPNYLRLTQAEMQWLEKHPEGKAHDESYVEKV